MIKSKPFNGLVWSFIDNFLQQIVNLFVSIILARELLPDHFGLIAIITVFITLVNTTITSGLSDALINKNEPIESDYNTVFWANILLGLFSYTIIFVLSPFVSIFFNQDSLNLLIRITALSVVFQPISSIHRIILTKQINYRAITLVSIVSVVISGVIAVFLANFGYGIFSLIVRSVAGQALTMILFWFSIGWKPQFIFDWNTFKSMYKYGIGLGLSRLVNSIHDNLIYLYFGKFFNTSLLGFYTRAETFKNLASGNIVSAVQRVSFSILSSIEDDYYQRKVYEKFISGTLFITGFAMTILYVSANEIILILIGPKWSPTVDYLKILSISGLFLPIYSLNLNLFAVKNRMKGYFNIELFTKLLFIPIFFLGIYFGIYFILIYMSIVSFIAYSISAFFVNRIFKYNMKEQLIQVFKVVILFIMSIFISEYLGQNTSFSLQKKLIMELIVVSFIFFFGMILFFSHLLNVLRELFSR